MMKTLLHGRKVLILLDDVDDREQLEATMEKLELSYIDPEEDYKDIFLDVAFLLKCWNITHALIALKCCDFLVLILLDDVDDREQLDVLAGYGFESKLKRYWLMTRRQMLYTAKALRTLDLSVATNLETLILGYSDNLIEVHFQKLRTLNLGITPNLETLKVNDCRNMVELRMAAECPKLVHLDIGKLKLRTLHLGITSNLKILSADMVELRMHAEYPKLIYLDIKRLKLTTLHLGITPNLETLRLKDCADMVELRMHAECPKLDCADMFELCMPAECPKLAYLDLRNNAKLRALDVGLTSNLEMVAVENCTEMVELYMHVECLKLVTLYLDKHKDDICMDNGDEQDGDTSDVEA
nr:hypothetical protein [Tanacetum cinerariifolium]